MQRSMSSMKMGYCIKMKTFFLQPWNRKKIDNIPFNYHGIGKKCIKSMMSIEEEHIKTVTCKTYYEKFPCPSIEKI
jgi:hypothetical protein